ncbi:MAG: ISNCY family transposase, partial [Desulfobulbaceae bacterium]|nr:ISNCY family transposase [Desulfobulbaceae bacterium]
SKPKTEKNKEAKEKQVQQAYSEYISYAIQCVDKIESTFRTCPFLDVVTSPLIAEIKMFTDFARLQNDQMNRRVLLGEKIPNNEKIFSVFEEYTEWISKGKVGVSVELGLKVCILEDQYGFILHHRVMQNESDADIAVGFIKDAQERFPDLKMCSFDKGFHSPNNQRDLSELLDLSVLPKKGKRSQAETDREHQEEFIDARHQHSAVESAINALEVHGLDRCPDRGLMRFYNYVALGVLGRNLHLLGCKVRNKAREEAEWIAKLQRAA